MKVLILKNTIRSYNVSAYNELGKLCDLKIGYVFNDETKGNVSYSSVKLKYKKWGPFFFVKNLKRLIKECDVLCLMIDPRFVSYWILPLLPHKQKIVSWGIGFRCSYVHPYVTDRKHDFKDRLVGFVLSKCDANIFYMEKAKEFWRGTNLNMNQIFVAPNTTNVKPIEVVPELKENILFVGTLYRGKGIDKLLDSFKDAINKTGANAKLVIVGSGEMKEQIEKFIDNNNLSDKIELTGPIYEESILSEQFKRALLCVSPTQGGLSCPKSMGYGVPFVCRKDAITGGEIFHMKSGVNGIFYEKDSDLTSILIDAFQDSHKYIEMGIKAKEYYDNNATPKHMAEGALAAFKYVLNN